jgi:succinate dehydrogenase / fumarate reductase flavoprotein subunit
MYSADFVDTVEAPTVSDADLQEAIDWALAPFTNEDGESPYGIQADLQDMMNSLVGIIRTESEIVEALAKIEGFKVRMANMKVMGGRGYNPGWHLALDLPKQLLVSQCVALSALTRQESRGGHTREDFPGMNPEWRKFNLILRAEGQNLEIFKQLLPMMTPELAALFDEGELSKYMTEEELSSLAQGTS